jgi:hypothetical protein
VLEVYKSYRASGPELQAFVARLVENLPASWKPDRNASAQMHDLLGGTPTYVFRLKAKAGRPAARVFLMREHLTLELTNIVPQKVGQLTRRQYNSIVDELAEISTPIAQQMHLELSVGSDRQELSDMLSSRAATALRAFSDLANKSTGSAHPLDRQRWFNFLILAHLDRSRLDTETLVRWLREESHWPEHEAAELGSEFDFARYLLEAYEHQTRQ